MDETNQKKEPWLDVNLRKQGYYYGVSELCETV